MGKDSSEIRREIEQTRARMGDTVEALSYKADVPARVKDAVDDKVSSVKGTISDVVETVKGTVGTALGSAKRTATERLGATGETMTDATSGVRENVRDKVNSVTSSVTDKVSSVTGKVGDLTGNLPSPGDVKNAARRGVGIAMENPLGLALGALAVGFLAGLAAPVTDLEREKIGPLRDDLVEKAQTIGSDVLEHGKQIVQETAQAALQTAQQSAQTHSEQIASEAKGDVQHGQGVSGQSRTANGARDQADTLEPGTPGTSSP
jgi:hypothetical protein